MAQGLFEEETAGYHSAQSTFCDSCPTLAAHSGVEPKAKGEETKKATRERFGAVLNTDSEHPLAGEKWAEFFRARVLVPIGLDGKLDFSDDSITFRGLEACGAHSDTKTVNPSLEYKED